MKRSLYNPPEPFSLSPLLALLPVCGDVGKLQALTSSLYARYERVTALRKEALNDAEAQRGLGAEEAMLKQVLDWLSVKG